MAMRPRGGRPNPNRPPRLIIGRVYEQFKPMSEWRQEDGYDTLLVYLPGFQKEYIKVTIEDLNIVRARGERLVAENKWSRFQEDFQVPESCEMRGIRARFDGGILTITMPKKISDAPATTPAQIAPKAEEQPFRRTKQEEALVKPKEEPKEKPTTSTAGLESGKQPVSPETPSEGSLLPPQPKPTSSSKPTKQEPLKTAPEAKESDGKFTFGSLPTSTPKKDKHDAVQKLNDQEENQQKGVIQKTDLDEGIEKQAIQEEKTKRDSEGTMRKPNDAPMTTRGFRSDKQEYKKVVKGIAMGGMNEEKQLLVNMGVAVLVIVALVVQVSHTIGSIGDGK